MPEDDYRTFDYYEETTDTTSIHAQPESPTLTPDLQAHSQRTPEQAPILNPGQGQGTLSPESINQGISESLAEELCSGKPFDAFTDLKNGSLFAFRGDSRGRSLGWGSDPGVSPPSHSLFYSRTVLL